MKHKKEDYRKEIENISRKLYLKQSKENIHILYTDGQADKLCDDLKDLIDNLSDNKTLSGNRRG